MALEATHSHMAGVNLIAATKKKEDQNGIDTDAAVPGAAASAAATGFTSVLTVVSREAAAEAAAPEAAACL